MFTFSPPEEKMLEPQENGLIDLPDYEHVEDETFPPFPPPASPERGDAEEAEPDDGLYRVPKKCVQLSVCQLIKDTFYK